METPSPAPLTARERDIIDGVLAGLSNREIGERLGLSERTVRNRLTVVFHKLSVRSRAQLLARLLGGGPTR